MGPGILWTRKCKPVYGCVQACQEVAATLSSIGVQHTVRATIDQGLLAIDVALPAHQIAVQVDGPNAYCSNEPFRPLGGTLLTWRLLRAQSWQVSLFTFCCGGIREESCPQHKAMYVGQSRT